MTIKEIFSLIMAILVIVTIILNIVLFLLKKKQSKATGTIYTIEKIKTILGYIKGAEQLFSNFAGKCGDKKLSEVLRSIKVDCLTNKENFNEEEYTSLIKEIVELTKTVNKK